MTTQPKRKAPAIAGAARLGMAALGLLLLAACEGALEVDDPEFIPPESLDRAEAVPTLINSAIFDFMGGYSGLGLDDKVLSLSGLIADELISSGTFTTRVAADRRDLFPAVQGNVSDEAFEWLHRALRTAQMAEYAIEKYTPEDEGNLALMHNLMGFTFIALAETFCDPLPFSRIEGNPLRFIAVEDVVYTTPLSTEATLDSAIQQFDAALALDANDNLAKVGKARALIALDRANLDEAAAIVASVPTTFVYRIEHSDNTFAQQNPLYNLNISNGRFSVANNEAGEGAPFRRSLGTVAGTPETVLFDPRLPWSFVDDGFDGVTPLYGDFLYFDPGSDVPLATGVEARLIEAEAAAVQGGGTFITILNDLRADADMLLPIIWEQYELGLETAVATSEAVYEAGDTDYVLQPGTLETLTDPGTEKERLQLLLTERGFWLYGTGHRQGDLRRFLRPEVHGGLFVASELFPTGPYHKGASYGDDVNYPVPFEEQNNELYAAVADQCDTAAP